MSHTPNSEGEMLEHVVSLCCTHVMHFTRSYCSDSLPDTCTTVKGFPQMLGVRFGLPALTPAPDWLKKALAASVAAEQGPFQQGPSGKHPRRLPRAAHPPTEAGARGRGVKPCSGSHSSGAAAGAGAAAGCPHAWEGAHRQPERWCYTRQHFP